MNAKSMNLLVERLKSEKSVLVYNFNREQFLKEALAEGLPVQGGADVWDGNGTIYAKHFYI